MKNSAVLLISCPDRKGIVATISDFVFNHNGNILHADEHADEGSNLFLMRVEFDPTEFDIELADFPRHFTPIAEEFKMQWRLARSNYRPKMIILVSKYDHCLIDLLYRHQSGELACDIPLIVSNHPDNQAVAEFYRIPYAVLTVAKDNKQASEKRLQSLIDEHNPDFIVLARYMQILSGEVCKRVEGRMINIHHSFLPSFKGAKPYQQAHARGVKLVGATAHYVTPDLDEGPIIEQDVIRVNHALSPERLAEAGRDVEAQVLARAVTWHAEHRVLLNGDRTVVFH